MYLFFLLLGGIKIRENNVKDLGIYNEDRFDNLCKRIQEFRHIGYIFEYNDGEMIKLITDIGSKVKNYSIDGFEHYDVFTFIKITDFSEETIKQLYLEGEKGNISIDQKVYLTRETLPKRIYGVHWDNQLEKIEF